MTIKSKIDRITDTWNYFIWENRFCSSKIKFDDDAKTNYFGDMMNYLSDTMDLIFNKNTAKSKFTEHFSFSISFLQAIYIQQDFMEELLHLFKTEINKGHLKRDTNYSINRDLRNELIGHPIRKVDGKLLSSTLFISERNSSLIEYLRYHKDNNFKFEHITHAIKDIRKRHKLFLNQYLDIVLEKIKSILASYSRELDKLYNVIKNNNFQNTLKLTELYFESIFKSDFAYDKNTLNKIYQDRDKHERYNNFINKFYRDIEEAIQDKKDSINSIITPKDITPENKAYFANIKIITVEDIDQINRTEKISYHYEISKLSEKRTIPEFDLFSKLLKSKCKDNQLVEEELTNMRNNNMNDAEYYTSLALIQKELEGQ